MYGLLPFSSLVSRSSVGCLYRVNGSSGLIGVFIVSSVRLPPLAFSSFPTSTVSLSSPVFMVFTSGVAVATGVACALLVFFCPRLENSVRSMTGVGSADFAVSFFASAVLLLVATDAVYPFSTLVVSLSLLFSLSVTISDALPVIDFSGLNMRRTHVMVCLLMNVSSAIATKNSNAVSPGGPTMFSMKFTQTAPWLPPGLNIASGRSGASTFARNIDTHIIDTPMPKNHFHKLSLYIPIVLMPATNRKQGIRKAA